ncbi:Hypothetical_protein [Hexamita inflata]|uniref:Hypothetical_protein n=1 Tax=Hexamita inflata TaxID=28002 RepID=A0AA86Q586_9EUKA|nr:Hypothetical protein HINF_LOCUS33699 [Hexamita inflata]
MPRTPDQIAILILLTILLCIYSTVTILSLNIPQINYRFYVLFMVSFQQFTYISAMTVDAFTAETKLMRTFTLLSYMTCYLSSRVLIASTVNVLKPLSIQLLKGAERLMCVAYLTKQFKFALVMGAVTD